MKAKKISYSYEYKQIADFNVGDKVVTTDGSRASVLNILKTGNQDVYKITLSDGRSFKAAGTHCTTVHFRTSQKRSGKKVYDALTTNYIKDYLNDYLFEIPTDDTFSLNEIDFIQHLEMLPQHEYEPVDEKDIIPDMNRDPKKIYIQSIDKLESEECWCLQLNDPLGLYITENGILTHNSLLTNLVMSYLIVLFGLMRDPYKQLGHNVTTTYALGLCCYTLNKAWDILGTPFEQFLESNPYFEKVGRHDDITKINREDKECKKCYYSTAARGSSKMIFRNNLNLKMISTEGNLLGVTFIYTAMTELAWWVKGGMTHEDIYTFFTKAQQRVESRMNGHYLGRVVIDSSPFSMESPIDKFIWETAINDPQWYCVTGAKWDWFPKEFPDALNKDGEVKADWNTAFPVYKGGRDSAPKMIETEGELNTIDHDDVVWCPRTDISAKGKLDLTKLARGNATEFLRDWAGVPAGSEDRIFQDGAELNRIFDNDLRSVYTSITADYMQKPENQIWDKIKDQFFYKFGNEYMFYRNPTARRVLAVDQATTGDAAAITVAHNEFLVEGEGKDIKMIPCTIDDFTIMIIPKGGRISLDGIRCFIMDLIEIGHLNIQMVNFDKFQSDATTQYLMRHHIPVTYVTADKNNEPYTQLIEAIRLNRVACGKNIFLKNNLRSLHIESRETGTWKYDHFKGKITNESTNTDWTTSPIGTNAKDGSDTLAECHFMLQTYASQFAPNQEFIPHKQESKILSENLEAMGLSLS